MGFGCSSFPSAFRTSVLIDIRKKFQSFQNFALDLDWCDLEQLHWILAVNFIFQLIILVKLFLLVIFVDCICSILLCTEF